MATFLFAEQAAAELGVNLATLYAYVSRGLIRSEADGRSRRFAATGDATDIKLFGTERPRGASRTANVTTASWKC